MKIEYDKEKISKILDNLTMLTGISINFLDKDLKNILQRNKRGDFCSALQKNKQFNQKCLLCDNVIINKCAKSLKFEEHICHIGLWDAAMPLIVNDITAGYIIMGRIKTDTSPKKLLNCNTENQDLIETLYNKIPFFDNIKIESLKELLPNILFESAIKIKFDCLFEQICEYINSNSQNDISIPKLCYVFGLSKNTLYKIFKEELNCTVNKYISDIRLNNAKNLLKSTNKRIDEVAHLSGIGNCSYFCRFFKKQTGMSPSAFRNS